MSQNTQFDVDAATALTFTDNVDLEPEGEENSALVWSNSAATRLRTEQPRLAGAVDYDITLDTIFSEDTDLDLRHNLLGFGTAEVAEDLLFLDAQATARQALISPESAVSSTGVSGRNQVEDVETLTFSPYLERNFNGWAEGELRYLYNRVFVGGDAANDSETNAQSLVLETGPRLTRSKFIGTLLNEDVDTEDEVFGLERRFAEIGAQWALSRQFSLLASAGYEDLDADTFIGDSEKPIWSVGFRAEPGARTLIELQIGERVGGTAAEGLFQYRLGRRWNFELNYTEGTVLIQSLLSPEQLSIDPLTGAIVDPTAFEIGESEFALGLQNGVFHRRRFRAAVRGTYGENIFRASAVAESRDFDITRDQDFLVGGVRWGRRIATNAELGASLALRRVEVEDRPTADTFLARISLDYQLPNDLEATAAYSFAQRLSDNEAQEFTENAITVGLRIRF